jgi:hypothetical protein
VALRPEHRVPNGTSASSATMLDKNLAWEIHSI